MRFKQIKSSIIYVFTHLNERNFSFFFFQLMIIFCQNDGILINFWTFFRSLINYFCLKYFESSLMRHYYLRKVWKSAKFISLTIRFFWEWNSHYVRECTLITIHCLLIPMIWREWYDYFLSVRYMIIFR